MPEFLLEIGCEELPAPWLASLMDQLRENFDEIATREHLTPAEVRAFATPRRLVLRADVLARQDDREETVWGPAEGIARDKAGKWTGAGVGFARKQGLAPEELQIGAKPGVEPPLEPTLYVYAVRRTPGRPSGGVLSGLLAPLLRSLAFPKRMSWDAWLDDGKGAFPFGRPIRWIVALLEGAVVPFTIHASVDGAKGETIVMSGDQSWGHRFLPRGRARAPIAVRSFTDLRDRLRTDFVLVDPAEREARIREGLASVGPIPHDHGLLAEWRDLVEYPTVVIGRIPAEFRSLPVEVLETVLVHHQKYIPLSEGRVSARFAAVTNTDGTAAAEIVRGMERVVVARLRDAAFFYQEDRKRPLSDRVADLAGVTFHQKLGSYKNKTERMVQLVYKMGAQLRYLTTPEYEAAQEAAQVAKADLTTLMVREFPELQGIMGAIYLRAEGHPRRDVIAAVQWHYHPISTEEDGAPAKALVGSDATIFGAVSLADKLDTLAGYFGLGMDPKGSSDPYALRRAAHGVIRVLLDFWNADAMESRPNLNDIIRLAVAGYGDGLPVRQEETVRNLLAFFLNRLDYFLTSRGFPPDEVRAVMYPGEMARNPVFDPGPQEIHALTDVHDCYSRLKVLHRVRAEAPSDFENLAVAFKRAANILEKEQPAEAIEPQLFEVDAERELHAAVLRLSRQNGDYETRLRGLATLRAPVDRFFDDVLVMAEDPRVRANRLGLLFKALSLFYRIADISKLGG